MTISPQIFELNINSYGYIATTSILLLSALFTLFSFFIFNHHKTMLFSFFILITIELNLIATTILINAKSPEIVFHTTRLLYFSLILLYNISLFAINYLTKRNQRSVVAISLLFFLPLSAILFLSDYWFITREILPGSYNKAGKGPLFPVLLVYVILLTIFTLMDFYRFYRNDKEHFKIIWPLYAGLIGFAFYMMIANVVILIVPTSTPQTFPPALFYNLMVILYVFAKIRSDLSDHDRLYNKYLFDPLTKVFSRDYLINTLQEMLTSRLPESTYIAMIDIDGFKAINDSYGHLIGDQVLESFGKMLNTLPPAHYKPGRLGGDEFMVIILNRPFHKVEMELKSLITHYTIELTKMNIDVLKTQTGLSIGLTPLTDTTSLEKNLHHADQIMYEAKKSGKNTLIFDELLK